MSPFQGREEKCTLTRVFGDAQRRGSGSNTRLPAAAPTAATTLRRWSSQDRPLRWRTAGALAGALLARAVGHWVSEPGPLVGLARDIHMTSATMREVMLSLKDLLDKEVEEYLVDILLQL